MPRYSPLPSQLSSTWRYALVGGVASIPLTVAGYWLSGTGDEFSLNAVILGGMLAAYLAKRRSADADATAAGVRAGVIGGLPAVGWMLFRILPSVVAIPNPTWFRAVSVAGVVSVGVLVLVFAAVGGGLGGKVGGWLAGRIGSSRPPVGN